MHIFSFIQQLKLLPHIASASIIFISTLSYAGSIQSELQRFESLAGKRGDAQKGQDFFTKKHANDWSCSTCHLNPPNRVGKHDVTGKRIEPLAPAANPLRFTDSQEVDKWFKRNCKDVLERECSSSEKADVLAFLKGVSK
ncbi:MAG: hypothetical protein RLZZ397_258 [Pseudomonadota bacterium]